MSLYCALVLEQPGTGMFLPGQAGTVLCWKGVVPQRGKADTGVCPISAQPFCAFAPVAGSSKTAKSPSTISICRTIIAISSILNDA